MSINSDPYLLGDIMNSQILYVSLVKFLVNLATSPTNFMNIFLKIINIFINYIFKISRILLLFFSFAKKFEKQKECLDF
jgi:hypothetical protein